MSSSGINTSAGLGPINFQGLISGLNTSSIIQELVSLTTAQEAPLEAQIATLNNQNGAITPLVKDLQGILSALSPLLNSSTFSQMSASSSNTGVFTATADTTAVPGSYNIDVTQLASPTSVSSQGSISSASQGIVTGPNSAANETLSNVLGRFVDPNIQLQYAGFPTTPTSGTFTLTHDGNSATINVNAASSSIDSIISTINSSAIGVTASLNNDKLTLTASDGNPIGVGSSSDTSNFLQIANLTTGVSGSNGSGDYTITSSTHLGGVNPNAVLSQASTVLTAPSTAPTLTAAAGGLNSADTYGVEILGYNAQGYLTSASPEATISGATGITVTTPTSGAAGYLVYIRNITAGDTTYQAYDAGLSGSMTITAEPHGSQFENRAAPDTTSPATSGTNVTGASVANFNPGTGTPAVPSTGTFTINGNSLNVSSSDTLASIISEINNSGAGVTATYNQNQDSLSLSNQSSGNTAISLSDGTGNFLAATDLLGAAQTIGKQSELTVNGGSTLYNNSNTVTNAITGVTLNLAGTGTSTLTISNNSQSAANDFNSVVTALNQFESDLYTATAPPTFQNNTTPGTAPTQTTAAGVLFGNFTIENAQFNVESSLLNPLTNINGPFQSLEQLGLSFTQTQGAANSFSFDSTQFQNAMSSNPQAVSNLATQLAQNVQNVLQGLTSNQYGLPSLVSGNTSEVNSLNQQITQIQNSATAQTQQLNQEFANMETILSQLQGESSFLSQQLGMLNTAASNLFSGSGGGSTASSLAQQGTASSLLGG
jgi:flagellar hook-associated protein 2